MPQMTLMMKSVSEQVTMAIGFSYEKSHQVLWCMTSLMLPVFLLIAAIVWVGTLGVRMGCRLGPCEP